MSYRLGDAADREEGDEELFETAPSVSGDEGSCDQERRAFVPPLRRMNSDSIYDMASMMSQQLPAKKGLSRYYEGKSQSFACMSEVRCLEDLRKKGSPYRHRTNKSYGALGLGGMMAKKPASSSCADLGVAAANGFRTAPIQNGYHQ